MIFSKLRHLFASIKSLVGQLPILIFSILSCCSSDENFPQAGLSKSDALPKVVVTTTHLHDIVNRLTNDRLSVTSLMGPGVDPHIYKPTSRDILAISKSDLIIFHGMMLEGKLSETLKNTQKKGILTYNATANLSEDKILFSNDFEDSKNHPDPHVWFDPLIWSEVVMNLSNELARVDPEGTEFYKANAQNLVNEISFIYDWAKKRVNSIPLTQRKLITSHDAFKYFGRAMGIKVIALQGISTATEAGLADRANLVQLIKEEKIAAIFVESSVNPDALTEIAKESKTSIGGKLFSDALGSEKDFAIGPNDKTYKCNTWAGMMIHNVNTIVDSLR